MEKRFEAMEDMLRDHSDRIEKLEAAVKRLEALIDACPDCRGRPGNLCYTCNGTGRKSGGRR